MAVSKAVTISRKPGSCSHSGLDSRSEEILTADLDMAVGGWKEREGKGKGKEDDACGTDTQTPIAKATVGKNQGFRPPKGGL